MSLQPGETKTVEIPFDEYTFRYFNVQSNAFEVEGGQYDIMVGSSSQDIRLRSTMTVKGTGKQNPYAAPAFECYKTCDLTDIPDGSFQALLARRLPDHTWTKNKPLGLNDTVSQLFYAKNPIARFVHKRLSQKIGKAIRKGAPELGSLFLYNSTFRGMAKVTNGKVTMDMAEDIVTMANGHWHKGLVRLIRHSFHKPQLETKKKN